MQLKRFIAGVWTAIRIFAPQPSFGTLAAGVSVVVGVVARTHVEVGAIRRSPDNADETVEDDKLNLELNAVHAGLERALDVEQVGALDAEQRNVERDNKGVGVKQLP